MKTLTTSFIALNRAKARHFDLEFSLRHCQYIDQEAWDMDVLDEQLYRSAIKDLAEHINIELSNNPIYAN